MKAVRRVIMYIQCSLYYSGGRLLKHPTVLLITPRKRYTQAMRRSEAELSMLREQHSEAVSRKMLAIACFHNIIYYVHSHAFLLHKVPHIPSIIICCTCLFAQTDSELKRRLAVLDCQLRKEQQNKRRYQVAVEMLLQFVEVSVCALALIGCMQCFECACIQAGKVMILDQSSQDCHEALVNSPEADQIM